MPFAGRLGRARILQRLRREVKGDFAEGAPTAEPSARRDFALNFYCKLGMAVL